MIFRGLSTSLTLFYPPLGTGPMQCIGNSSEMSLGMPVPLPLYLPGPGPGITRRNCLPASHNHANDISLWNILRNNIGKDLSKVSMPVQLNEPLNMLQRLCEELEYSALLDAASCSLDPCERLVICLSICQRWTIYGWPRLHLGLSHSGGGQVWALEEQV